ncbi:hypothetical protein CYMTET_38489 [Cymbomonas tetramitiformis]|uniref:Alpha-ketoglutarate-dependent dioxygenase AlkB-like domain-containing protein n=1 Tax=Cymbomonas tetramitiformis TaxID=36881 RepID=A0AAE0F6J0_9CHLO|nr:hypothetical protein CYMTET_55097 [Cymbomonas tetramitiformis]KAK3252205.1 hypothetical protein CYMTET_38489 [Cymbomonas tetramitiformis]
MTLRQALESDRIYLSRDSWYIHVPRCVEIGSDAFEELWALRDEFEPQYYRMFGKRVRVPRIQGLFSDQSLSYKFYGHTVESRHITMHPFIESLLDSVSDIHNTVFVNWYQNGKDYVSAQSDCEQGLPEDRCIISVSLNATRTFRIRPKQEVNPLFVGDKLDFELGDGDLFVMGGNFQREFLHEVLKKPIIVGDPRRINLTTRGIVTTRDSSSGNKRKRDG